jgi:cytoskeletal protein CcmA (bactofilin family)
MLDSPAVRSVTSERRANGVQANRVATVGRSVVVKGELTASEDVAVDGRAEGRIHLPDYALTIGPNANIQADVVAKMVTVFGSVVGRITAGQTVDIRLGGSVVGDLVCMRLAIQDGAHVCGKVDMGTRQHAPRGAERPNAAPTIVTV